MEQFMTEQRLLKYGQPRIQISKNANFQINAEKLICKNIIDPLTIR